MPVPEILASEIPEILAGHLRMRVGVPREVGAKGADREISSRWRGVPVRFGAMLRGR